MVSVADIMVTEVSKYTLNAYVKQTYGQKPNMYNVDYYSNS